MTSRPRLVLMASTTVAVAALVAATLPAVAAAPSSSGFRIGAAFADITPPALDTALGRQLDTAAFVPVCGLSPAQVHARWPGLRRFAFEEPYIDLRHVGRYVPGDPYCDADGAHRYQAPYIAGGSGENHWPLTSADSARNSATTRLSDRTVANDPISAQAVVFTLGTRHTAMVTVDSIGLFKTTMDQIRAAVTKIDGNFAANNIFISSTHDESAPDPIGLWGPDLSDYPPTVRDVGSNIPSGVTSGVDEYYMDFLVDQVANAIINADRSTHPGALKVATARMPANTQSCWSSYPFIDSDLVPVMQGIDTSTGGVIFTLVNVGTHDETLAFSGTPAYKTMLSGDWTGRLSQIFAADFPGSVGMQLAGLVGSVETPALYPAGTQVVRVPGQLHDVAGNPVDGCRSVYPEPAAAPETDALAFISGYASSVASAAEAALQTATTVVPTTLRGQALPVCLQLENNLFLAAFAAGLFPDRPAYADPLCTVGVSLGGAAAANLPTRPAQTHLVPPAYIRSEVGVLSAGPVQLAYSPGEVFPFTEIGGPVDHAQMPFPTNCYLPSPKDPGNPAAGNYWCGSPLPMTANISAEMTGQFRFLAGLGEDMIGYLFPPGNFVGDQGETLQPPWSTYEDTANTSHDRFGYGHSDDSESVGPHAGIAVTKALASLLSSDGAATTLRPGLFVDAGGRLCDSPFPSAGSWITRCTGFTGAVGVRIVDGQRVRTITVGPNVGWATYLATPDSGTAGTADGYSVATRGVIVNGSPLLIDVVKGADALLRR